MRAGGETALVTTGPADQGSDRSFIPHGSGYGASRNGQRLFFATTGPLVAADTDADEDLYLREGATTTLISAP